MYIAYSVLQPMQQPETNTNKADTHELNIRYQAYQTVCSKYLREIAAIQKYFPGWAPSPPAP